jgi:hypothetical protein
MHRKADHQIELSSPAAAVSATLHAATAAIAAGTNVSGNGEQNLMAVMGC